nr:CAP domain-containing protein [Actinomycetota bacterium]
KRGAVWHNAAYVTDLVGDLLGATWVRGENVVWSNDVDHAHRLLLDSPAHRMNMLDPRYAVAGFAVARSGDGNYWVTQNFLEPISSPVPSSSPPPTASQDAAAPSAAPDPAREVVTAPGSPVAPSTSGASSPDRPTRSSEELDPSLVPVPDRVDGAVLVAGQRRPVVAGAPPGMAVLAAILVGVVAVGHGLWWWAGRQGRA